VYIITSLRHLHYVLMKMTIFFTIVLSLIHSVHLVQNNSYSVSANLWMVNMD